MSIRSTRNADLIIANNNVLPNQNLIPDEATKQIIVNAEKLYQLAKRKLLPHVDNFYVDDYKDATKSILSAGKSMDYACLNNSINQSIAAAENVAQAAIIFGRNEHYNLRPIREEIQTIEQVNYFMQMPCGENRYTLAQSAIESSERIFSHVMEEHKKATRCCSIL